MVTTVVLVERASGPRDLGRWAVARGFSLALGLRRYLRCRPGELVGGPLHGRGDRWHDGRRLALALGSAEVAGRSEHAVVEQHRWLQCGQVQMAGMPEAN